MRHAFALTLLGLALVATVQAKPDGRDTKPGEPRQHLDKGTNHIALDTVGVIDWIDLQHLISVELSSLPLDVGEVPMDRDFRDFLVQTIDREKTEMGNQEN